MKIEIFIEIINKFSLYLQKIILLIENTGTGGISTGTGLYLPMLII